MMSLLQSTCSNAFRKKTIANVPAHSGKLRIDLNVLSAMAVVNDNIGGASGMSAFYSAAGLQRLKGACGQDITLTQSKDKGV